MAPIRPCIGLSAESPGRKTCEKDIAPSPRTVDWAPSVTTTTTTPSFTFGEAASSLCAYQDLSAFRDLNRLHEGRHSTVWSAVVCQTGQTVVIKGYNRESLKTRQLNSVRREISLLRFFRDVGCKGVVGLLAVFEDKAMIYLVFEACMGGDLYAHLMRNRGTLHEEYVVTKVVFPLLSVLQQLHKLHIVHRDIKPENIFLTETGEIALGDFGLAGHKFQDRMTERVGTLDYMAPEVLSMASHDDQNEPPVHTAEDGAKTYDEKIDIWAAGVLVYELLVGRPPFEVDDPHETARLILTGQASNYPVHISAYARDFVAQALTKSPEARPSAEQLLQHAWLSHYFGGKLPDPSGAAGGGVTAGLLKSWLVASWADLSKASPRPMGPSARWQEDDLKLSPGYARNSVPGSSDGGSSTVVSPSSGREASKQQPRQQLDGGLLAQRQLHMALETEDVEARITLDRDAEPGSNRLVASQYPSRDSSTGSMDQAVPTERLYVRNDSGASASSGISIASFASLQNMPRSASINHLGEEEELGLVQRSASICPANISRIPPVAYPAAASTQLKPVWQSSTPPAGVGVGSKKTPGKSRFAG